MAKAVILLSGGLDSAVMAAYTKLTEGYETHAVCFDYGQRHREEIIAAGHVAEAIGLDSLRVIRADMSWLDCSLSGAGEVAKDRTLAERSVGLAPDYVPGRNTVFLSLAASYAETIGVGWLVVGWTTDDESGFPDCTPKYRTAMNRVLKLGTASGVQIAQTLAGNSKSALIFRGKGLGLAMELTWTCYDPQAGTTKDQHGEPLFAARHCGVCDACFGRKEAFTESGFPDPTTYA